MFIIHQTPYENLSSTNHWYAGYFDSLGEIEMAFVEKSNDFTRDVSRDPSVPQIDTGGESTSKKDSSASPSSFPIINLSITSQELIDLEKFEYL